MKDDTQAKLDEDALKDFTDYFGCADFKCSECPAAGRFGGKYPDRYYFSDDYDHDCEDAMKLDLLRRQREIDATAMAKEAQA